MSTNVSRSLSPSLPGGLSEPAPVPYLPRALPFDDPAWLFQPRHEGVRGFLVHTAASTEVRAARGLGAERLADLAERVGAVLGRRHAVLDGDVVALDREGRSSHRELVRGRRLFAFAAFDLLWVDGEDVRALPLSERQRRLGVLLPEDTGPLYKPLVLEEHGRALFQAARRLDLEGIVARRKQDAYGPETVWYSIRNPGYTRDDGRIDPFRRRSRVRRPDREAAGA